MFQTGWYSEDEGLHLSSSIEGMKLNLLSSLTDPADFSSPNSVNNRAAYARSISQPILSEVGRQDESILDEEGRGGGGGGVTRDYNVPVFSYQSFISRTWSLVVVSVAIFGTCVALWMLVYVLIKICDGTLLGNQV